jgi:hypothetical protein
LDCSDDASSNSLSDRSYVFNRCEGDTGDSVIRLSCNHRSGSHENSTVNLSSLGHKIDDTINNIGQDGGNSNSSVQSNSTINFNVLRNRVGEMSRVLGEDNTQQNCSSVSMVVNPSTPIPPSPPVGEIRSDVSVSTQLGEIYFQENVCRAVNHSASEFTNVDSIEYEVPVKGIFNKLKLGFVAKSVKVEKIYLKYQEKSSRKVFWLL